MSFILCPNKALCLDPANPFSNLSAEAPDPNLFIGYGSGGWYGPPPIDGGWGTMGCVSFCFSTISQADADRCAENQQLLCTVGGDGNDPGNPSNPGWTNPGGSPVKVFANTAQTCIIECPDGLNFAFTVPANQYLALSQAYANSIADTIACKLGQEERMCLNNAVSPACVNVPYSSAISPQGGTPPILFTVLDASFPPGVTAQQTDSQTFLISGTPTVPGNYHITLKAVDRFGLFMVKTLNISVLGITNTPPAAQSGIAYSFSFTVTGGTPPYTFAIASGSLPAGLVMDQFGNITGTATTNGTSNFTVSVTDSSM